MGMFGRRKAPAYDTAGIEPPGIGGRILNQIGMNVLGVDFEGMRLRDAIARKRAGFEAGLAELVAGSPDRVEEATIQGGDGSDISAAFSPQMDFKPGRAPIDINNKQLPALIYQADRLGVPVTKLLEVMKAQQPDVRFDRGFGYNAKTGEAAGGFHPELGEGRGIIDGRVATLPGYAESVGEIEGTRTGAQERAKAQLDLITIDLPDGSKQQIPRDVAVQAILQSLAPGGGGGGLGRSRTPEATALATGRATNAVKQEGMVGEATTQAQLDLPKVRDQAQNTLNVLQKIRAHPSLSDRTGNSTLLPALRPQDVDFDVMVRQIGGGAFLEAIQSLKGTGQITEIEGQKATDAIARMQNQRQSREGFLGAMQDYENIVRKGLSRTAQRAGGGAPQPAVRWTPEAARAELARRRAAAQGR